MRQRLLHSSRLVLGLLTGTLFAVLQVLWAVVLDGEAWSSALVRGALMGLFFGALMGPLLHRQQRGVRAVAARSPEGLSPRVRRASWRGPVPTDPGVRAAALDLAHAQLEQLERQRHWGPAFFALMAAVALPLAFSESPWWWLAVAGFAAATAVHPYQRHRMGRRVALLEGGGSPEPAEAR